MASLNRRPRKLHSKWSKLYRIVALKGVIPTVDDYETEESLTVHVDRLALSSPPLKDEIEPFVSFESAFRSVSNPSLHGLFGERPWESSTLPMPTPLHDPTQSTGSIDFLDPPRPQGKRSVRRNRDPDYAYLFMSRTEMKTSEYSGARQDDIRRQQSRRARVART